MPARARRAGAADGRRKGAFARGASGENGFGAAGARAGGLLWFRPSCVCRLERRRGLERDDADMGIKWGPTSVGGDRKGFVMVSGQSLQACLIVCGISINDERLPLTRRPNSNSDTGGGFYLLAQRFGQYGSEGNLPDLGKA